MDGDLHLLKRTWKSLKSYYMQDSVVNEVFTELLKLIGDARREQCKFNIILQE